MKLSKPQSLNQQLGNLGEDLAATYLSSHGYTIVARNFRIRWGELDLVVIKNNILVVVEVKTRIGKQFGSPLEAVTSKKLKELIKTTEYFVYTHPDTPKQLQIDVIGIELDEHKKVIHFDHVQNVTG